MSGTGRSADAGSAEGRLAGSPRAEGRLAGSPRAEGRLAGPPRAHRIDPAGYLDTLRVEGALLPAAARTRTLDALVPHCPGWVLRDVVAHLGWVYGWVALTVREQRRRPPSRARRESLVDPDPSDGPGLVDRFVRAHEGVVAALADAPADLACWTPWPAASAREFWLRRQVHETLVHRVDAQNAGTPAGQSGAELPPVLAADGVDELVCGFIHRFYTQLRHPTPLVLGLHAVDTGDRWWIRIGPGRPASGRGAAEWAADTEVRALAGELFLLLWNRRTADGLDVRGESSALGVWHQCARR